MRAVEAAPPEALLARHVEDVYTARDEEAINVLQSEETLLDVLSCMASKDMETKKAYT